MPPFQGGGDMIKSVTFEKTTYNELPYKFEAGTPHIAGAIGLAAGLEYIAGLGLEQIGDYEHELLAYGTELLSAISGVRLIGTARHKAAVLSFVLDGVHAHDLGTILDLSFAKAGSASLDGRSSFSDSLETKATDTRPS
jgi:cysteine desulfurase / selenocysteine lyase